MQNLTVEIVYLPHHPTRKPPLAATPASAGVDLIAAIREPLTVHLEQTIAVPTGIAISPSIHDVVGLVIPRSGLGTKHGLVLANTIGVIDSDYRGEILLFLRSNGYKPYVIEPNERLAQLVFMPILRPVFKEVEVFSTPSERGTNGFGSSGRIALEKQALEQLIERGIEQLEAQAHDLSFTQRLEYPDAKL